ncbi:unnamed protein product [Durusdinium trenchii]|uniref:Uncharacterized protein n=2 Tax=Durusdinium trenchii TaxID=1381693 RepID=A0ABP0L8T1_9DINO
MFGMTGLAWEPLQRLETFSGAMSITKGEWQAKRSAVPMDIELDGSGQNILDNVGFCNMLHQVLRLEPGHPEVYEINDFADRSLQPQDAEMVVHYTDGNGRARVKGGASLKASQAYPDMFFGVAP